MPKFSPFKIGVGIALSLGFIYPSQVLAQSTARPASGNQIVLNGRSYSGYWFQSVANGQPSISISDGDLDDDFGLSLLNTNNPQSQPVQWFSSKSIPLTARFPSSGAIRYLDITTLKDQLGWQIQPQGNRLIVNSGAAQVRSLKSGIQPWGRRIVLELDRPSPWRFKELTNSRSGKTDRKFSISVDAALNPTAIQGFKTEEGGGVKTIAATSSGSQTILNGTFSGGLRPEVWTLSNPPRLVVDFRPDPIRTRNIAWAPGLRWQESVVNLGLQRFPVSWMEINPKEAGLRILPIWGNQPSQLVGIHPLAYTSARMQAAASINAGFFDRKLQNPLGAIRRDGNWLSTPILNRGVIAWNDSGQFQVGRMSLAERITTSTGKTLTITAQNSGYPQGGLSRYTNEWGRTYIPIKKDGSEQIFTVVNNQVLSQSLSKSAAQFPIPSNGYLLVARGLDAKAPLAPGTTIQSQGIAATPGQFDQYPHIMGAGPLLLSNNRVVLNIGAETFQKAFEAAAAPRSAIAQKPDGTIMLVTCHNRVGGAGPTLGEWARILQQMGGHNALNLDGGSSTTLYLGGRLVDRHPITAARVQNGLGVFLNQQKRAAQ